jgi:Ice-binding-like/PEP-CTERM motif
MKIKFLAFSILFLILVLSLLAVSARADSILGTDLSTYAILAGSAQTGATSTIVGNVGVSPGTEVDLLPVEVTGTIQPGTQAAAQTQLTQAFGYLGSLGTGLTETSSQLGGLVLAPGVYTIPGTALLDGTLTLNGEGNANAAWVFKVSGLTTGSNSSVVVENTGAGAGIYWFDTSSTTLGVGSSFEGNILAQTSISLDTGATDNCGRVLASTGGVSLLSNTIVSNACTGTYGGGTSGFAGGYSVSSTGVVTLLPSTTTTVPEPSTLALLMAGLFGLVFLKFRKTGVSSLGC